jgi:hypothetical protein
VDPAQQRHFQVIARLGRGPDVDLGLREDLEGAHEILARKLRGEGQQPLAFAVSGNLGIVHTRRVDPQDEQVAGQPCELPDEEPQIVSRLHSLGGQCKRGCPVLARHGFRHVEEEVAPDEAQHGNHVLDLDCRAGEGNHLVERALRVAHAAVPRTRHQHDGRIVDLEPLGVRDPAQLFGNRLQPDGLELEDLRAGLNRRGHLLDLGGRHHEDDVRRRLLDGLEERVERLRGEPVDFVDDEDLVAVADRRHAEAGNDHLADLVHLRVGRRVDLEDVHVASLSDLDARVTRTAGVAGRALFAVQAACEDAGGGGLPDAARAREDERLRNAPDSDGVAERLRHPPLPDDVVEALRAPLAGKDLVIGHGG